MVNKVEKFGTSCWSLSETHCIPFSSGQWWTVSAPAKATSKGKAPSPKKAIGEVLDALGWEENPDGGPMVAHFTKFLKELKLPGGNPGKRAQSLNKLMARAGYVNPLQQMSLGKPGQWPWVGSRQALKNAYMFL